MLQVLYECGAIDNRAAAAAQESPRGGAATEGRP
jgi:hypothetical protein